MGYKRRRIRQRKVNAEVESFNKMLRADASTSRFSIHQNSAFWISYPDKSGGTLQVELYFYDTVTRAYRSVWFTVLTDIRHFRLGLTRELNDFIYFLK